MKALSKSLIIVLLLTIAIPTFSAAKLPPTDQLLPKDAVFYFNIDSFQALENKAKQTRIYNLFNDPSMKPFIDGIKSKFIESIEQVDKTDDLMDRISDANAFPQGRISFALLLDNYIPKGEEVGFFAIVGFGENIEKAKKIINQEIQKQIDQGLARKKETIAGCDVTVLIDQRDTISVPHLDTDNDGNSVRTTTEIPRSPFELRYTYIDDNIVIGADVTKEFYESILVKIKSANIANSLSTDPDYRAVQAKIGSNGGIDAFVNMKTIIKLIESDLTGETKGMFESLGLNNLTAIGLAADTTGRANNIFEFKMFAKVDGEKKGILKIIDLKSTHVKLPDFVDPQSVEISTINFDFNMAFEEINKILTATNPQAAMMVNMPIPTQTQGQFITLSKDLLAYLEPQIVLAKSQPQIDKDNQQLTQSSINSIAVNNHQKLEESIAILHAMATMGQPDLKRPYMGYNMYLVDISGMAAMFGGQAPQNTSATQTQPKLAITITETHMLIALEKDVEKAIRTIKNRQAASIESQKWYTAAKSVIPQKVGSASFANIKKTYELIWDVIRDPEAAKKAFMQSDAPMNPFEEFAKEIGLLPSFSKVSKYFGIASGYLTSTPDGFYYNAKIMDMPK